MSSVVKAVPSTATLVASFAGGNFVSMVIRMVTGLLQARLVSPATLGLFSGIGLVMGYAPFFQLGILSGLNRELPYYVGRGERDKVQELAAAAQAYALLVGGTLALALLCISGWYLLTMNWLKAAGWFTNAVLALVLFYNAHYLQLTFRTSHDFARLALAGVVEAGVGCAALIIVAWLNFYGLCVKAILAGAASTAFLFYWRPIRVLPRWNPAHLKHLFWIGCPIFAIGLLYSYWGVINSTMVLRLAGDEGLGLYVMVGMATTSIEFIPNAVVSVTYPRMAELYGRGASTGALIRSAVRPMLITFSAVIPIVVVSWLLVGPAVRLLVPGYEGAIRAMQWALLLPLITCFSPVNTIFNIVRKNHLYAIAILFGMAANGICLLWLTRSSVDLAAFPQAMLVGRVGFIALCYYLVLRLSTRPEEAQAGDSPQAR